MLGLRRKKKGQSTLEYAIIIVVVIGGLLAMNAYVKRGLQGRLRDASDQIGEQFSAQTTTSDYLTQSHSKSSETFGVEGEGVTASRLVDQQYQRTTGSESVGRLEDERWPE